MSERFIRIMLTILISLSISVMSVCASSTSYITKNGVKLDKPYTTQVEGHIRISGSTTKSKIKLLVIGVDKQTWYELKVINGEFTEEVWFDSQGEYTISVMVNEYDRKYSEGPGFTVNNTEELDKYLIPAKHIESNEEIIIDTALEITKNCSSDSEKVRAIYEWVVDNIEYDYEKLSNHNKGQYDNRYGALNTLNTRKGVCYDYSTLVAALSRSLGIKAKVVEGNLNSGRLKGFHAWNEIFISDRGCWINMDTTLGSTTGEGYFDFADNDESYLTYEYK
jgi:transglutaminase-like putative cysteine protease